MGWSNWKLGGTGGASLYLGSRIVVGGGRFTIQLNNGQGSNYSATYTGGGVGVGAGIDLGADFGRLAPYLMDYFAPSIRAVINSAVGTSQDLYLSNLYSLIPSELNQNHLSERLWITALGGEIGAGLSGALFAWQAIHQHSPITPSVSLTRFGRMPQTRRPEITALAVAVGVGVGLVGASATETVCICNSFTRA